MKSNSLCSLAVLLVMVVDLSYGQISAQVPGERLPSEVVKRVQPALKEGQRALAAQDAVAVRAAVAKSILVLGPWAGNPETATRYYPPIVSTPFDAAKAREWWLAEVERGKRGLPWVKNPTGDPRVMVAGLREAAFPLDGLARTALLFPEHRDKLSKEVREGADWLIKLQHPSGVFPFPVGLGLNPRDKVGHIVARAIKDYPEIVVNDWIPDDQTDGGLQFDNGLCGRALISAWELTRDERYLTAARKAGDWAITRPLASNWNYNAFSVGLLARLAEVTQGEQKEKYLTAAVTKAEVGGMRERMIRRKIVSLFVPIVAFICLAFSLLGERQHCLYRKGEAPAEPKPSSAGASLFHWNPWQVVDHTIQNWVKANGCKTVPVIVALPDKAEDKMKVTRKTWSSLKAGDSLINAVCRRC